MRFFERRKQKSMRRIVKLGIRLGAISGPMPAVEFLAARNVPTHVVMRVLASLV
jgi:hypothetical protein